jgi:choice-of-anchor A domain-containing protein
MRRLAIVSAATLFGLSSTPASAAALDAATILSDFNAVIYSNASNSSDIEGAAVIGGNANLATVYNKPTSSQPAGFGALTVYGSTSGNNININNGGNAYVDSADRGAHINFNGGGNYIGAPGFSIKDFETPLNTLSTSLSRLASTEALPVISSSGGNNNLVFKATPGANGIAVFDITAAQLAEISSFSIDLNGAASVIFNVSGASVTYAANDESGSAWADKILWNFYDATTVNLNTLIGGTVLATGASVTNGNQIDGTLVASSLTGNGELHDYGFDGALPTKKLPEPSSITLLGVGVGLLGCRALFRRKKSAV